MTFNIIIAGVGGQGNIFASSLLGNAALEEGYHVTIGEVYGAAQRGGSVMSFVRFDKEIKPSCLLFEGKADLICGLEPVETIRAGTKYLNPKTTVIVNPRPVHSIDVITGTAKYPPVEEVLDILKDLAENVWIVDATELAKKAGDAIAMNVVMVGAVAGTNLTDIKKEIYLNTIKSHVSEKVLDLNLEAFGLGYDAIQEAMKG